MGLFRRTSAVLTTRLHGLPGNAPLRDDVFLYLLEQATRGDVPVFFGAVPRELISPFDTAYDPSQHSAGEGAIQEVVGAWQRGQFSHVWVYPKSGRYVLSDDYIIWAAVKRGEPEFLPSRHRAPEGVRLP